MAPHNAPGNEVCAQAGRFLGSPGPEVGRRSSRVTFAQTADRLSHMSLAWTEIKRAKLRFGLLTGAVALLVFLIMFLQTLSETLLKDFIGGLENQSASVIAYSKDARRNLDASVVTPQQVQQVAQVPGVGASGPLGEATFTVRSAAGRLESATFFGYELGGPGAPTTLSSGRLPQSDGEAVASTTGTAEFAMGNRVSVQPGGYSVTIVGLADNATFNVQPTLFVSYPSYELAVRAQNPQAKAVLASAVAVDPAAGISAQELASRITQQVPGVEALDRATAVSSLPGVSSIQQSFGLILLLAFFVVVLVTGFFFLILTVQKSSALTLLRAIGASTAYLLRSLVLQVTMVTLSGVVVAGGLLTVVAATSKKNFPIKADPVLIVEVGVAVLVLAITASIGALRRIVRIDPATATSRSGQGGLV